MSGQSEWNLLIAKIREGTVDILQDLMERFHLSTYLPQSEGIVLVSEAIQARQIEIAKLLLTKMLPISIRRQPCGMFFSIINNSDHSNTFSIAKDISTSTVTSESSILESAILNGDLELLEMLLDKGINVNPPFGNHPLHIAIESRKTEFVELLLNRGANVNVRNNKKMTPLHMATINGHLTIAEKLLDKGACVNSTIDEPKSHSYAKLHYLDEDFNRRMMRKLLKTAGIIEEAANPSFFTEQDNTNIASGRTKPKENFDETPISYAVRNVDVKMAKLLLNRGADIHHNPNLLSAAVITGNLDIVESVLQQNIRINDKDRDGETALHRATLVPNSDDVKAEIAKLLLSRGASVHSRNRNGQTPLHLAAQKGYAKLVETLLGFNSDEGFLGNYQSASTEYSIFHTSDFSLKNKAAQLYAKNMIGETALHMASSRNHQTVVEVLLKHGVDIESRTIFGKTALDVAFENGCRQAFLVLLKYGSDINVAYAPNFPGENHSSCCVIKSHRGEFISSNSFCLENIKKHIIKIKSVRPFISEGNLRCLDNSNQTLSAYRQECNEEVRRMKNEIITRNITFHDVLQKGDNQMAVYTRDKNIVQVLESKDLKNKFPIYCEMICYNFQRGHVRELFLNVSSNAFNSSIKYSLPPEVVITDILRYLTNEDLENLLEACTLRT